MLLYHFNFGYPLLQADTLVEASKAERTPMNELSTDYHHMMAPVDGRGEELYFRTTSAAAPAAWCTTSGWSSARTSRSTRRICPTWCSGR